MHQLASGSSAAAGLLGGRPEPPVNPETIGRPPSNFEAPAIPVLPFPQAPAAVAEAAPTGTRRLVVRLLGGEEVELGSYGDRSIAIEAAQALAARFSSAEAEGEWPEIDGRFVRPGAVASIDVLVANGA
jgi:hypothetical protein